jgi:DNA-binding transcriptional LysR family regulator
MDRLASMQIFVAVAESGGFAAAARRLGVSPPAVTRAISMLEAHLGASVLQRTTRKVRLTEAGARYLEDARRLLAELDDVEAAVSGAHGEPRGELTITAPTMFGRLHVTPILLDFLTLHPHVTARLLLSDRVVDLIDEGVDLAVRVQHLASSSLNALRVGELRRVVCASPRFVKQHGLPRSPADLAKLPAVVFASERSTPPWIFEGPKEKISVRPRPLLLVNASEVAIQAAIAGHGVTRALSYMVAGDVAAGRLRILLEDFEPEPIPIHLVHREGRRVSARVRAFLDFARDRLRADPAVRPLRAKRPPQ